MRARTVVGLAVVAVMVTALAGCGSSKKTSTSAGANGATGSSAAATGGTPALGITTIKGLGQVLVDRDGRTLYTFKPEDGGTIACTAACASNWPPYAAAGGVALAAADGARGAVGTIARPDGSTQITYNGHPLYRYAADQKAGDANGQGVANLWFVATPSIPPVATATSGGPTTVAPRSTPTTKANSGAYSY